MGTEATICIAASLPHISLVEFKNHKLTGPLTVILLARPQCNLMTFIIVIHFHTPDVLGRSWGRNWAAWGGQANLRQGPISEGAQFL